MDISKIYDFTTKDEAGCWNWERALNNKGYGMVNALGKMRLAHRISYEKEFGPIPTGLNVLHRCDNPRCINPKHLFLGTQMDNVHDAMQKGRHSAPPISLPGRSTNNMLRGSRNKSAKITEVVAKNIMLERVKGRNFVDLGREFGLDPSVITLICKGEAWAHVLGVDGAPTLEELNAVPTRYNWTDQSWRRVGVDKIKPLVEDMISRGIPSRQIMAETGVSKPVLYRIKNGFR